MYSPREKIVYKKCRKGVVQFICKEFVEGKHLTAWDIDNNVMSKYYSEIQDFTDQATSCDAFRAPENYPDGKVPMSVLMKEFVTHFKLGNKTWYYVNTKPKRATTLHNTVEAEDGCESCKL